MPRRGPAAVSPDGHRKVFLGLVVETAGANVVMTALAGGAGLYLASQLGATNRGRFAAIQSWYGILTIVGELGLTAATCFHVAREPERGADWMATSRDILLLLGAAAALVGFLLSPLLAQKTAAPIAGFLLAFAVMPILFVTGAWTFGLQATDTRRWNISRAISPGLYATGIAVFGSLHRLTVFSSVAILVFSVVIQAGVSLHLARDIAGGRHQRCMIRPLLHYGLSSMAGSVPFAFNGRVDQVLLTVLVPSADLGNYAVAVSLTLLASPLSAAFGSVIMPTLAGARRGDESGLVRTALLGSFIVGVCVVTPIACATPFLLVPLLGQSFDQVPVLVGVLAPGAVILGCNQVLGDILRGKGRPLDAGTGEAVGLVATIILLALLVPRFGARGAAVASTCAYAVSFLALGRQVAKKDQA